MAPLGIRPILTEHARPASTCASHALDCMARAPKQAAARGRRPAVGGGIVAVPESFYWPHVDLDTWMFPLSRGVLTHARIDLPLPPRLGASAAQKAFWTGSAEDPVAEVDADVLARHVEELLLLVFVDNSLLLGRIWQQDGIIHKPLDGPRRALGVQLVPRIFQLAGQRTFPDGEKAAIRVVKTPDDAQNAVLMLGDRVEITPRALKSVLPRAPGLEDALDLSVLRTPRQWMPEGAIALVDQLRAEALAHLAAADADPSPVPGDDALMAGTPDATGSGAMPACWPRDILPWTSWTEAEIPAIHARLVDAARLALGNGQVPRSTWVELAAGDATTPSTVDVRIAGGSAQEMRDVSSATAALFFDGEWSEDLFRGWRHSLKKEKGCGRLQAIRETLSANFRQPPETAHEVIALRRAFAATLPPAGLVARR